jgi:hypothetical protein
MGIADVKKAARTVLEAAGGSLATCQLGYRNIDGSERQVITLTGTLPSGKAFSVDSDPHDPNSDPVQTAVDLATTLLATLGEQSQ